MCREENNNILDCQSSCPNICPPGPQGPQGPRGPKGDPGCPGPKGDVGYPGPQGAPGPMGPEGLRGQKGPLGEKGDKGDPGCPGPVGPRGPQGQIGPQGPLGVRGDVGPQGDPGCQGPMGPRGNPGPAGPQGISGPIGPRGNTGPAGPQGVAGPEGSQGPQGIPGPSGAMGPEGPAGVPGPQGSQGSQGCQGPEGPQGIQGDVGPTGPQGVIGSTGPQGDTGPTGAASTIADSTICYSIDQWANVLEQLILLYPSTTMTFFAEQMAVLSGIAVQVYSAPSADGAGLLVIQSGSDYQYIALNRLAAVDLGTGSVYNPSITYLPAPDPYSPGCDTNYILAIQSSMSIGDNISFGIGVNTNGTGEIYMNEPGVMVISDGDGNTPIFIFTPQIRYLTKDSLPQTRMSSEAARVKKGVEVTIQNNNWN